MKKREREAKMNSGILKASVIVFTVMYMVSAGCGLSYAALMGTESQTETKSTPTLGAVTTAPAKQAAVKKAPALSPEETAARNDALMASTAAVLAGKEWTIHTYSKTAKGGAVEIDTLVFTAETMTSKNLEAKGYPVSNYGMLVQDNGAVSWETMKTDENKNKAFLRGDYKDGAMVGVIFMKPANKGATSTYGFSTSQAQAEANAALPKVVAKKK